MAKQYQVLARKWRPQQFEEVVGQDHITTTLRHALEQNRLAHAYLFVGPRGIGKTSTARIFAKALNCQKGPTATPCGKCDNCLEIAAGNSLDVLEIDGASNNGVDQVRELRETCRYAPARSRYKIYIIDEVHMLTTQAFNALLKTLEEPPAHVKFIFATTEPQKMLPTILSRCQRFDLRRIPAKLIVQHLKKIAKSEKITIDDKALAAIARGAEGGLRDAESALDQLIAFCGDKIAEPDVLQVFGLVAHDHLAALTDALIDGHTNRALAIVKELDDQGKDLLRLLADLLEHFRNLMVLAVAGGAATDLEVPDTTAELLANQAKRIDSEAVLRVIDTLAASEGRLRYALSKRIFFEIALLKAVQAREMVGLEGILRKLNELKAQLPAAERTSSRAPAGGSPGTTPAPERRASAPVEDLGGAWAHAVEQLGRVTPLAKTYLTGSQPLGLEGQVLTIGLAPEYGEFREFVDKPRNLEVLQARLKEKLHRDLVLRFTVLEGPTVPATPPTASPSAAPSREAPRSAAPPPPPTSGENYRADPLIHKALEIFKATIVEVKK